MKRIITDPRTLNKQVFAYNELWTYTEIYDLMEKLSGETITRTYVSETMTLDLSVGEPTDAQPCVVTGRSHQEGHCRGAGEQHPGQPALNHPLAVLSVVGRAWGQHA